MTIATDFAAYHSATKRVQATSTSTLLFGTSGLLAEALPDNVRQIALIPAAGGVYYNWGTASAATGAIPAGGIVLDVASDGVQAAILHLYAATSTYVAVSLFEHSGSVVAIGGGLTVLEANLGNVGLLNAAETEIDPSEAQATNTAFTAADMVTPAGAVRKSTEALPEAVADGDYIPLQTDDTGSLRVTDDSANTSLAAMVKASNVAFTNADKVLPAGMVRKDTRALPEAVADGDYVTAQGTSTGELRVRDDDINTDMDTLVAAVKAEDGAYSATDKGIPSMAVRKDARAAVGSAANGDYTALQTTASGELRTRDDDVNTDMDTLVSAVKAEDGAYAATDKGVPAMAVRKDTEAMPGSAANGDYVPLQTDATGSLRVTDDSANTVLGTLSGSALTFGAPVVIAHGGGGSRTTIAQGASKIARLHALVVMADAATTFYIASDTDGAGTGEDPVTGTYTVGAKGGMVIPFTPQAAGCPKCLAASEYLTIVSAAALTGYAIGSTADS